MIKTMKTAAMALMISAFVCCQPYAAPQGTPVEETTETEESAEVIEETEGEAEEETSAEKEIPAEEETAESAVTSESTAAEDGQPETEESQEAEPVPMDQDQKFETNEYGYVDGEPGLENESMAYDEELYRQFLEAQKINMAETVLEEIPEDAVMEGPADYEMYKGRLQPFYSNGYGTPPDRYYWESKAPNNAILVIHLPDIPGVDSVTYSLIGCDLSKDWEKMEVTLYREYGFQTVLELPAGNYMDTSSYSPRAVFSNHKKLKDDYKLKYMYASSGKAMGKSYYLKQNSTTEIGNDVLLTLKEYGGYPIPVTNFGKFGYALEDMTEKEIRQAEIENRQEYLKEVETTAHFDPAPGNSPSPEQGENGKKQKRNLPMIIGGILFIVLFGAAGIFRIFRRD